MTRLQTLPALLTASALVIGFAKPSSVAVRTHLEEMSAFGRAVAIAGEFAFVGEPNVGGGGRGGGRGGAGPAPGTVHVFRNGATGWKEVDKLSSSAPRGGDGFGVSLAAEGATLLVGQVSPPPAPPGRGGPPRGGAAGGGGAAPPPAPPPADTAVGTVQVYRRGADMKWTSAGPLVATHAAGAQFGAAMAVSGDIAIVGAPGEASGGSAYVFKRAKDGSWSPSGSLPAQGLAPGDRFGAAIAMDGTRAAVGSPTRKGKGAVFVFRLDSTGTWMQETEQAAPSNLPDNALMGSSVAVKDSRVIVGAPGTNFSAAAPVAGGGAAGGGGGGGRGRGAQIGLGTGMVLAYLRAPSGQWRMASALAPFDFANANFGAAVGVVGDELWIGAPGSDGLGRIYRAREDKDGGWSGMTKLGIDSLEANAQFAASFATSGNNAIIGLPGDGSGGGTVAFFGKGTTGSWAIRSLNMPPVVERFAQVTGKEVKCTNAMATAFECGNTDLLSYLPISAIGGKRGVGLSGNWGWTDPVTGHDIALIGRTDGTAFVDVTDPIHPRYLGDLMRTKGAQMSSWREIKTYKNYALIVSDGSGDHHGIQIFDLTHLRNVVAPHHFLEDAHFEAGSIHDIAVNEQSGFAYAVGTNGGAENCSGGLLMVDMHAPLKPKFAGCFAEAGTGRSGRGYTHDVQCVMYHGPDKKYTGHEICMAANETTVSIQDVTDKKNVKVLSHADYPSVGYTHQGWFTADQHYWYLDDELDEEGNPANPGGLGKSAEGTRTMIFDMSDLEQPVLKKEYIGPTHAIDHNQYVKGDRLYQANYLAGLRVLDISDPLNPKEIGFFDTTPGPITANFGGVWNQYPFFKNGAIGVSSMGEGFFLVRDVPKKIIP